MVSTTSNQSKVGATTVEVRFAIAQSVLGWVIVAASEQGICAIEFGDTSEILQTQLQTRFPTAQLQESDPIFSHWVAQVIRLIQNPACGLDVPLDIQGTAFQKRVWTALQTIPSGATVSYAAIAQQIDQPTATRAVATACAANTLAVAIPCHRVVRSNGDLSGYRWGLDRKRALLEREALS